MVQALTRPLPFWSFFVVITVFRIIVASVTGLSDDEAYYWDWSRQLSWSYFDHPPLTAWLIRVSTSIFGTSPFTVRLPALVLNSLTWWLLYSLGRRIFNTSSARLAALIYLLVPIYSLGGIMIVPDIAMSFFWVASLYLIWQMYSSSQPPPLSQWVSLGSLLGLGFLSKYTIVLIAPCLVLFLLLQGRLVSTLRRWPVWIGVIVFCFFLLPIIVWNSQYGWPSFYFHLYDRHSGGGLSWARWGSFWASQILLLTPAIFTLVVLCLIRALKQMNNKSWQWVLSFCIPVVGLFELQSLFAEFKPHWPAPGYLPCLLGIGYIWYEWQKTSSSRAWHGLKQSLWVVVFLLFALPVNLLFYVETVYPIIPKVYNHFASESGKNWQSKWDPTNDLYGWDTVAETIRTHNRQKENAAGAFFASHRYQLVAPLAFALRDKVWSFSPQTDHYDFQQTEEQYQNLIGRSFYYIADNRYLKEPTEVVDASCSKLPLLNIYRHKILARTFHIWYCENFEGTKYQKVSR